jgi:hypothetical protein
MWGSILTLLIVGRNVMVRLLSVNVGLPRALCQRHLPHALETHSSPNPDQLGVVTLFE